MWLENAVMYIRRMEVNGSGGGVNTWVVASVCQLLLGMVIWLEASCAEQHGGGLQRWHYGLGLDVALELLMLVARADRHWPETRR
jgi:hypothetical protein